VLRLGTDIVDVGEVAASLQLFGDRYARRVFTPDELGSGHRGGVTARAATDLAERFAAKEAVVKVLAPGERGLDWRSMEVCSDQHGGCTLRLSGAAATLAHEAGIGQILLSVSSAGGLAMAVAVASAGCGPAHPVASGAGTSGAGTSGAGEPAGTGPA
jgi:holo-[acyl-carrier protein] synthase